MISVVNPRNPGTQVCHVVIHNKGLGFPFPSLSLIPYYALEFSTWLLIENKHKGCLRRTDVVVDYNGEQFVCELKIWHGEEYNRRGEEQLADYLEAYHLDTGYVLSFNFNKRKKNWG